MLRGFVASVALLASLAFAADVAAQTVVPMQVTGPPSARFNMVILGDGYTAAELPRFRAHADHHMNVLWSIEPFKSYRSYINVYRVEIASPESGVDCDPNLDSPRRDTPLAMGFWGGCNPASVQRLLTVNGAAANQYANLVAGTTPANRQILAIGNSDTYGGAGGANATASGGNALSALITPHELGHSLGGLQDEYDYFQRGVPGGTYSGGEPASIHHTILTEQQMREQQRKWWRWLGEPSESGGTIGRYEAGMYLRRGIWRPSEHSMMKVLGYYFDQVSRERMTQRISARAPLIQASTPVAEPIGADRVVWVETQHPVSHALDVIWTLDGAPVAGSAGRIDLARLDVAPGVHTLTATVVDPTGFVRDPAVRATMTQTRTWTVDTSVDTPPSSEPVEFTSSTSTLRPVGRSDVVYAETTHPADRLPAVIWSIDGRIVADGDTDLDLSEHELAPGRHTLTARLGAAPPRGSGDTLTWAVDADDADVDYELSRPLLSVDGRAYVFNAPFTMRLTATDDTPGYLVREFRVDGDGWYHYYGWPTDPDAPFRFTAEGTNIDDLVYGKLGKPRVVPWDDVPPGYGRHTIEYRAIDPAGNVGAAREFDVTLLEPPPACSTTLSGRHGGRLTVASGVVCLDGARVGGPVRVAAGASLVATDAVIEGPVTASGAATVQLLRSAVGGAVRVDGSTADVTLVGGRVGGPVVLRDNRTADPPVVAGVAVGGPLACTGNEPAPVNLRAPNSVAGPATGQCADL